MSQKMKQESVMLAQHHSRSACARSAAPSTNTVQRGSLRMVSYPAERQWFCARITLSCFIFGDIDHHLRRFLRDQFPQFEEARPCSQRLQWQCWKERPCIVACTIHERAEAHLFFSLTRSAFHLIATRGESSVMTRNRFFAVQRRALLFPPHI